MRPGQNRRVRGRSNGNRKGPNPLTRSYESNGPDVKIRGTAQHIAEKYAQLARDAQVSGDPVASENYLQHAEHYFRIIAAAQAAFQQEYGALPRSFDDSGDDGDGDDEFGIDLPRRQMAAPGDDAYPVGAPQPGQNGQSAYRERNDRQERSERPQRGERYERQDRQDRSDRQERPDRQERSEHRQDRQERVGRGERQPRASAGEGYEARPEGEREPRDMRDSREAREPRDSREQREPRGGRRERFRRDRDVRQDVRPASREPEAEVASDDNAANGLPAFLTMPLRAPAPAPVEQVEAAADTFVPADAPQQLSQDLSQQDDSGSEEGGDRFPVRARRRRGRTRTDSADNADTVDAEESAAG